MDHLKAETMLSALGTVLEQQEADPVDVVICGAMVLLMQGVIARPTRDIDGLGMVVEEGGSLVLRKPLMPDEFAAAVERVGNLYGEGKHWFSTAATILHDDTELPPDIVERAEVRHFGERLTVRLCSREHMVCLKMWAAIDRGEPDIGDLIRIKVSEREARTAAEWCLEQDAEKMPEILAVLEELGHEKLARELS
ncbi:MAG: hypothetical protein PHP28_02560 [Actinomycetota bacterium]|nr:hypothetical protein [Actinomycetota bacterium]MDD5666640.1 hypothetical protein [Actinomycetota bacterium]